MANHFDIPALRTPWTVWKGAMLSKSVIQFSVDGWGCVPPLWFSLRANYGRGNGGNGELLQKDPLLHCCIQCPWPLSRLLSTHISAGDSWTLTGKSTSCGDIAPFSWLLACTRFVCALQEFVFTVMWKFCNQIPLGSEVNMPLNLESRAVSTGLGKVSFTPIPKKGKAKE